MRFAIFPLHLSKVLRRPRKIDARSYEVLHLSRKIILANLQIGCSKMQPFSGNQPPDLLTSLMNMSFVLRLPREMHLGRSSSNVPRLPWFLEMRQNPHVLLTFDKVHNHLRLPRETTSELPKSGASMWCFVHFAFTVHRGDCLKSLGPLGGLGGDLAPWSLDSCLLPLLCSLPPAGVSSPPRCFPLGFEFKGVIG